MKEQRRGRRIAMSAQEVDAFLGSERTCRVASVGPDGSPHNTPLWFVWDGASLWLNSLTTSQRWADLQRDPRVGVVVDAGEEYGELRGVELRGSVAVVGDVPRTTVPDPDLDVPERLFGEKYLDGAFISDGRHAWLRLVPEKVVSWDFRKIGR
ncbi:MAG TPA: pyridoxamine 5'-phosphate oxidase family protein [Blastococcus sp.]|nr:pyridoxamine 5'-phosphate oxidase family protein [Blastococcus sp.]